MPAATRAVARARVSRIDGMTVYASYEEAGRLLAEPIEALALDGPVVLGLGDEGLAVARPVAERLGATVAAYRVAPLPLPWRQSYAFGAVTEDGHQYVDPEIASDLSLGAREIAQIVRAALQSLGTARAGGTRSSVLSSIARNRPIVVVAHALSTGYRALAAVAALRAVGASEAVVAAPCAAGDAATRVGAEARLVVLHVHEGPRFDPADFYRAA